MKTIKKKLFAVLLTFFLLFAYNDGICVLTGKQRNILAKEASAIGLKTALIKDLTWNKLPGYDDRDFWLNIPEHIRNEYIKNAESYLEYDWPAIKATDFLEFIRSGDRRSEVFHLSRSALSALVMGELVEGKGRFLDQIINGVWYHCEQTWWGYSAHLSWQTLGPGLPDINEPYVDLGAGEMTSDLSWIWVLFNKEFDKVHPLISRRLKQEIFRKSLDPYLERYDYDYMGFTGKRPNNWNPWLNYNMLTSYLIMEQDSFRRISQVKKVILVLDLFLNGYSDDGGCDEGPSYWGAAGGLLYECLDLLKSATGGAFDVFDDPLVRNIGSYIYKVNIHAPRFINFSDADATTGSNPALVYRYGKAIGDTVMQKFGAHLAKIGNWGEHSFGGKIFDQIRNLVLLDEIKNAKAEEAFLPEFWFPDTEVAGARDQEGTYEGFFFGAKGGFNAESHNHNDVGSCVMYYDGKPCLIDLGRETYVAKTFSSRRYEIWTMQSGYHNLPVINGCEQMPGQNFKAKSSSFSTTRERAVFSTDIAGAYPEEAGVVSWIRSYTLNRGKSFVISDQYKLNSNTGKSSVHLMTSCKVIPVKKGILRLEGEGFSLNLTYNPQLADAESEFIEVTDKGLKRFWPGGVTRIILRLKNSGLTGKFSVMVTKSEL